MPNKKEKTLVKSQFLSFCDKLQEEFQSDPFAMIIFGGTGDLSQRKLLPALYHLFKHKLIKKFTILSLGTQPVSNTNYRNLAKKAVKQFSEIAVKEKDWKSFSKNLFYEVFDINNSENYNRLCARVKEFSKKNKTNNLIYYLAIPPSLVPIVMKNLSDKKLCRAKQGSKIILEKPFGRDEKTAVKLNQCILTAFNEDQIYRIDHYLGKETVQNILFFRFANSIFEPLWNRNYIDHIQITVAENLGVGNRAKFYEESGVIRDIVQNHMMQLIALIAMETPVGFQADLIRDEKVKVFRSMRRFSDRTIEKNIVVGQYGKGKVGDETVLAYRQEKAVSSKSNVPTFFAGKFYIDNWRWSNVPIYIRTGKRLAKRATYITIIFKQPPLNVLGRKCDIKETNHLMINVQPQEEISLQFSVKYPGTKNQPYPVDMIFNYQDAFHTEAYSAYERLLLDCMKGDQTLFERQDGVVEMWSIVDPIISYIENKSVKNLPKYASGSWGPKEADTLIEKDGREWIED